MTSSHPGLDKYPCERCGKFTDERYYDEEFGEVCADCSVEVEEEREAHSAATSQKIDSFLGGLLSGDGSTEELSSNHIPRPAGREDSFLQTPRAASLENVSCHTVHPHVQHLEDGLSSNIKAREARVSKLQGQLSVCLAEEIVMRQRRHAGLEEHERALFSLEEGEMFALLRGAILTAFIHDDAISPLFGVSDTSKALVVDILAQFLHYALEFLRTDQTSWPESTIKTFIEKAALLLEKVSSGDPGSPAIRDLLDGNIS